MSKIAQLFLVVTVAGVLEPGRLLIGNWWALLVTLPFALWFGWSVAARYAL